VLACCYLVFLVLSYETFVILLIIFRASFNCPTQHNTQNRVMRPQYQKMQGQLHILDSKHLVSAIVHACAHVYIRYICGHACFLTHVLVAPGQSLELVCQDHGSHVCFLRLQCLFPQLLLFFTATICVYVRVYLRVYEVQRIHVHNKNPPIYTHTYIHTCKHSVSSCCLRLFVSWYAGQTSYTTM
jgi:hypothetical protein